MKSGEWIARRKAAYKAAVEDGAVGRVVEDYLRFGAEGTGYHPSYVHENHEFLMVVEENENGFVFRMDGPL